MSLAVYNGSTGPEIVLSDPVRENAAAVVRPFEVSYGSVSGTLSGVREAKGKSVRVTVRDMVGSRLSTAWCPIR